MTHDVAIDAACRGLTLLRKVAAATRDDLLVLSARRADTPDEALAIRLADEARATLEQIRALNADIPVVVTLVAARSGRNWVATRMQETQP
jgi:hypothetical protein